MKAGTFNINDYLGKLQENSDGNLPAGQQDGLIIPEENKKSYGWLKKEYDKAKVEVKVEIKMGGSKFKPGYEMQTDLKSVKDFKPGLYGQVKTSDTSDSKKDKPVDTAQTTAKKEGKKPEVEKKAEVSTGDKGPKSKISGKVKTAEDEEEGNKEEKKDKKEKEDDKT